MDCNNIDSETLNISDFKKNNTNGDLFHIGGKIYDDLKIKIASLLFIIFIILNSDIFVESVMLCAQYFHNFFTISAMWQVVNLLLVVIGRQKK